MKTTISFVDNATTKEAGVYALKYGWAFTKGVCKDINSFVYRLPWICVAVVSVVAVATGFILVNDARMERDHANKEMVKLQQQVERLSCAPEDSPVKVGSTKCVTCRHFLKMDKSFCVLCACRYDYMNAGETQGHKNATD